MILSVKAVNMEAAFVNELVASFRTMATDLVRGLSADSVGGLPMRASAREAWRPVRDTIAHWLQQIAESGVETERENIESTYLNVKLDTSALLQGVAWDLSHTDAINWALASADVLTAELAEITTPRIQRLVAEWLDNSEPLQSLIDRIRDNWLYSATRAEAIAITETTRAIAEGNMMAWLRSGLIDTHMWVTSNDELVCPICGPLHNRVAKIGAPFSVGVSAPPAHPRCRCSLAPVPFDDEEPLPVGLENQPTVGIAGNATPPTIEQVQSAMQRYGRDGWRQAFP